MAYRCSAVGQGSASNHYSIAQHSWYCSFIGPSEEALERLLHDGSELIWAT